MSRGRAPTLAAKSFSETARAVAREVQRTGAKPSAAFRALQLRQAAQLAEMALDRLNWSHPSWVGDDVDETAALANLAKRSLEHALYGPNADPLPLDDPPEWKWPKPSLKGWL
jgi:hypothetical protein